MGGRVWDLSYLLIMGRASVLPCVFNQMLLPLRVIIFFSYRLLRGVLLECLDVHYGLRKRFPIRTLSAGLVPVDSADCCAAMCTQSDHSFDTKSGGLSSYLDWSAISYSCPNVLHPNVLAQTTCLSRDNLLV